MSMLHCPACGTENVIVRRRKHEKAEIWCPACQRAYRSTDRYPVTGAPELDERTAAVLRTIDEAIAAYERAQEPA